MDKNLDYEFINFELKEFSDKEVNRFSKEVLKWKM